MTACETPQITPEPQCVVRVGEPCRLCQPGATGPHDCQLAYLVRDDEDLRAEMVARFAKIAQLRSHR